MSRFHAWDNPPLHVKDFPHVFKIHLISNFGSVYVGTAQICRGVKVQVCYGFGNEGTEIEQSR